ncbi:MAG: sigma-70 family RNA polymerase sigma factor [Verrucomicrobia bacterium]|nr:sigma-70 family RNA polymerase sigma factor [Verrucomicrobiota bacterium]MBU4497295.1 sigma-70 family RNA polymerase sigma factor [Verrucomicrobiota bacterium]MCG2681537.1 sigma-70 family RNA polymerase sigma factor [Kiritimatiellia bacterium]
MNETLLRHYVNEDAVVRAYVRSCTMGHRETDDVLQEIWKVVCVKIGQYDESRPFRAWVMGIARMQVLKWRQTQARSREVLSPETIELFAETAMEHGDELDFRRQHLRECLSRIPALGRQIMRLKYFDGLTIATIGLQMKKSTAAIEMALVRFRRFLRACIEKQLVEERLSTS